MKSFAELYFQLDQTNSTNQKVSILANYFEQAEYKDKIFALALLCGRRPKRTVQASYLRKWAAEQAELPDWLFEESYHTVGDLAETIAMLIKGEEEHEAVSLEDRMYQLQALDSVHEDDKRIFITQAWSSMSQQERFVFNKLITGGFRVGVSQKLVEKSLARILHISESEVAHRLSGNWSPFEIGFDELLKSKNFDAEPSKPYPFYLAYQIDEKEMAQWNPAEWQAEWKWDGIRSQLIIRNGDLFIWSRGEELITERFPELHVLPKMFPDGTVIDGEMLCIKDGKVQPFQHLQTRIGRKTISKKMLAEYPVAIFAYDLLEFEGKDIRDKNLFERRFFLEGLLKTNSQDLVMLSPLIEFRTWDALRDIRATARKHHSEGIMLKRLNSIYQTGRKRGDWWKWKIDPMTIDAVMIYAMKGHGRRANLYTDYTFAIWNESGALVPFTKAYSGLTDEEIKEVDDFVKRNTIEKFGPVRSVQPHLVFEIGFEGIQHSSRHKSGFALRFPRILRWRKDKKAADADNINTLKQLIPVNSH
ncbi:MAG: ATP-dependent DNA ligase [Flavobacteriales bacterium]